MSLYHTIVATADKLFPPQNIDRFMPEIAKRLELRTDITTEDEKQLAINSAYRDIRSEYVAEKLHEARVEEMMKFIDLYNSCQAKELTDAMFEAMSRTHRTIQADALGGMMKLFEQYATADSRYFDGRNAHWKGIAKNLTWAYYHPDKMDSLIAETK